MFVYKLLPVDVLDHSVLRKFMKKIWDCAAFTQKYYNFVIICASNDKKKSLLTTKGARVSEKAMNVWQVNSETFERKCQEKFRNLVHFFRLFNCSCPLLNHLIYLCCIWHACYKRENWFRALKGVESCLYGEDIR